MFVTHFDITNIKTHTLLLPGNTAQEGPWPPIHYSPFYSNSHIPTSHSQR